jgi:hypothetical protein
MTQSKYFVNRFFKRNPGIDTEKSSTAFCRIGEVPLADKQERDEYRA